MPSYEELRRQNLADNRRILAEIGLINPYKTLPKVNLKRGIKRKAETPLERKPKRAVFEEDIDVEGHGSLRGTKRRSARIKGNDAKSESEIKLDVARMLEDEDEEDRPRPVPANRPNVYGSIEGVEVGTSWLTRMECCRAGIHRPPVCGIHGGPEGAYSIALSGEYEDNIDLGECFTYTGEGGRDLKGTASNPKNLRTAPQSKDQTLTRGNLALSINVETKNPVRVIRGYKLDSVFAPEEGYRYDGLYSVEKAWFTTGLSGFGVWKFALRRCSDQAPPPWNFVEAGSSSPEKENSSDKENETSSEKEENNNDLAQKVNGESSAVSSNQSESDSKPDVVENIQKEDDSTEDSDKDSSEESSKDETKNGLKQKSLLNENSSTENTDSKAPQETVESGKFTKIKEKGDNCDDGEQNSVDEGYGSQEKGDEEGANSGEEENEKENQMSGINVEKQDGESKSAEKLGSAGPLVEKENSTVEDGKN